ncbi:MAG: porin family protein [Proteobacteria bacterium]|nr:porin family protein [Pseudomonadota bacterium]
MKRILLGILLASTAMSAQAADLAARPYTKAPVMATVYDWTGFYIGANAGLGLGRDRTNLNIPAVPISDTFYQQPQGGLGGAQIGYNWQTNSFLGPMVLGLETDIQGADLSDNYTCLFSCTAVSSARFDQKLDWFGTARGRIGLVTGPVLSYVTAGFAYGGVRSTLTETVGGVPAAISLSGTRTGWTWGSGVEAALGGNWTGKIEYLYVDLGSTSNAFALQGATQTLSTTIHENIFRAGLNYRIGGNGAYSPVAAANWTGFYLGGNVGSGTGRDRSSLLAAGNPQFNLSPDGYLGGVQGGYNWQTANWVYGVEADIQASSQRDNRTCIRNCILPAPFISFDSTLPWFGTVRGRLGYTIGSTLLYATGGYAYGGVNTKTVSSADPNQSFSQTKSGWTAGAGLETPFTFLGLFGPNWTSKTEYLYVDLGSTTNTFVGTGAVLTSQIHEHIFRTGLNYHFNTPVVARY